VTLKNDSGIYIYTHILPKIMIHWKPEGREKEAVPGEPGKMEYIQP